MMEEPIFCHHCGKVIKPDDPTAQPYVTSDKVTHLECAEHAALEEVSDLYNVTGEKGIEHLDHQADIQNDLEN